MASYRKKPVEVEAMRWDGSKERFVEITNWMNAVFYPDEENRLPIYTLEGVMTADEGDWIIRGVAGEFYPCKPEIFDATYEAI